MEIALETPVRATLAVERNKADTWSVGFYLIDADGRRDRRCLGVYESDVDATEAVRTFWTKLAL
ncbi:hypothetical protein [Pelagibius sp.]|uniref:hypothetical protein n=1 Tax=Pelagibius sp. TaxID=1931238 RepID=UPI003BB0C48C